MIFSGAMGNVAVATQTYQKRR